MWKSEDDMLRDIFLMNASVFPIDEEAYNRFYTNRQEYKLQNEAKNLFQLVDPRNGEILDEKNLLHDISNCKATGKGRGKEIKSNILSELQLQKQLRLAKPLGFSNEMIELHYSSQKIFSTSGNSSKMSRTGEPSQSEVEGEIFKVNNFLPLESSKKERVKGVRNSMRQNNFLLLGLSSTSEKYLSNS